MFLASNSQDNRAGVDDRMSEIQSLIYEIGVSITANFKAVEELSVRIAPVLVQNSTTKEKTISAIPESKSQIKSPLGEELERLLARLNSLNYSLDALIGDICL